MCRNGAVGCVSTYGKRIVQNEVVAAALPTTYSLEVPVRVSENIPIHQSLRLRNNSEGVDNGHRESLSPLSYGGNVSRAREQVRFRINRNAKHNGVFAYAEALRQESTRDAAVSGVNRSRTAWGEQWLI